MIKLSKLALSLSFCSLVPLAAAAPAYYRFPAIQNNHLVFTAEGDLWKVATSGGVAQRLTTHPAAEVLPAISRDGQWLAFSAAYEGSTEAYVMPIGGGLPKRISFENDTVSVLGWSSKGDVLVNMLNGSGPHNFRVVAAINPVTGEKRVFPVSDANEASLDDSGRYLYFTRFGLQVTNDNAKHYRGGATAQIWRYDTQGGGEASQLFADDHSNNRRPMWWNGKLYFVSDRNGSFNLWQAEADGSQALQLSRHQDWDVRNASIGDGKIAYQLGADLHVFDIAGRQDRQIAIELVSDFDQQRQQLIRKPLSFLSATALSGKNEQIALTARGHITVAGTGAQRRVELPVPAGSRARSAVFSADGKSVYAILDTSGENEIWRFAANGLSQPEMLSKGGTVQREKIYPSPDGKWLAHTDKRGRLYLLNLGDKSNQLIDDAGKIGIGEYGDIAWSADSSTLAIVRPDNTLQRSQIALYTLHNKRLQFVTSDRYESHDPVFSPDGHWLYFLSERNFKVANDAPWGDRNMGPVFDKRTGVYALALQAGQRFPFQPEDELSKAAKAGDDSAAKADKSDKTDKSDPTEKAGKADKADKADQQQAAKITVEFAGLAQRLYQVPLAAGNYRDLASDGKRLYFIERDGDERKNNLKTLAIANNQPQPELFISGIRDYQLSADRKHLMLRPGAADSSDFFIVEAGARQPQDMSKAKVALADWSFSINPRQEWQQMFVDAWRMHRDYLFDDKMRGVDWLAMRHKYAPLAARVNDRSELNDVLAQMVSEVGTLHSQFRPGDLRKAAEEASPAALGALLQKTRDGYRIEHIYRSEPEQPAQLGPLAQPGLDIREGDLITRVNGQALDKARDISDLLLNQADKQVLLHLKRNTEPEHAVIVKPVNMQKQAALRYSDWEQSMSTRVQQASKGQIGYLHLRAMGPEDINSFAREFYSNIDRAGLIIDVRRNRGGNIDSWIIEKLLRRAWAFWSNPVNAPYTNMQQTFRGHLVVLIDELTYSDGETFAAGIKELKLAPLVGKRTAGAGVWLSDGNALVDNGMVRAAENGQFALDGRWLVEGSGVTPDIEVTNLPNATFKGQDQQLETAIRLLQDKLRQAPLKPLQPQPIPVLK